MPHGGAFAPDDDDWPCTALRKPRGSYAHSTLLRDVHRAYASGGLGVDAEYPSEKVVRGPLVREDLARDG